MSILDRRLLVVTGKGGVGKTTLVAAIGLAAARSGRRALLVELAGQQRLARLFNGEEPPDPSAEVPLYPGLMGVTLDPQKALEEYLTLALRIRALAERLAESRAFGTFSAAVPGLRELVTLGKLWHLTEATGRSGAPRYGLVVLDAPATGHGVGLLRAPRAFLELAPAGRVSQEAQAIAELLDDPARTGIVVATLPEEIPVTETIDAVDRLRKLGLRTAAVVVNGLYPPVPDPSVLEALSRADRAGPLGRAAARAALTQAARRREQDEELARLAAAVDAPRLELPFLFEPDLGLESLGVLADLVGPRLEAL